MQQVKKSKPPRFTRWISVLVCSSLIVMCTTSGYGADDDDILNFLPAILAASSACSIDYTDDDPKYELEYLGLHYYRADMSHRDYALKQLSDRTFRGLSDSNKRLVADKLLATLFFGYPENELADKLSSRNFLCSVRRGLLEASNDMVAVEEEIVNEERYYHSDWAVNEAFDILARFYAMEDLDKNYLHNWMAYILTQTILFSPAYELDSSHYPNIASVYNWLVFDMNYDIGMRYSSYLYMTDLDNWRRFRSPEDNGREMLEIYTFDFDDANVPKAARTLQNWYLDDDGDTLVVGLNQNTVPQSLFGTTVTTGFDYYRELVKSAAFQSGVIKRIVDFFFLEHSEDEKQQITDIIVSSDPKTWQDVFLQIVFSEEYLLHTTRVKSAEELFYSLVKKLDYKHYRYTFYSLHNALNDMNQASMKYKLGKLERVPLDTISFAVYHKYIRENLLVRGVCGEEEETNYDSWNNYGWRTQLLLAPDYFTYTEEDPVATLTSFITYLFTFVLHREPNSAELDMFLDNMLRNERTDYNWSYDFERVDDNGCYSSWENTARDVLDYISRLSDFYRFQEVAQ